MKKFLAASLLLLSALAAPQAHAQATSTVQGLTPATTPYTGLEVMWCGQGLVTRNCQLSSMLDSGVAIGPNNPAVSGQFKLLHVGTSPFVFSGSSDLVVQDNPLAGPVSVLINNTGTLTGNGAALLFGDGSSDSASVAMANNGVGGLGQLVLTAPSGTSSNGMLLSSGSMTGSNAGIQVQYSTGSAVRIMPNAVEKARWDGSGRLLVGTTTGTSPFNVDNAVTNAGGASGTRVFNNSSSSNTVAEFVAQTGTSGATLTMSVTDGITPVAAIASGSNFTAGFNLQTLNGVQVQVNDNSTGAAVNRLILAGASTTFSPQISTTGSDTNVGLGITTKGTGLITLGSGSNTVAVGPGGSVLSNGIHIYTPSITPTATSAAIQTALQTTTVTGLSTSDTIYVNGPAPTSLCPMVGARVSAANTLQLEFVVLTAAACTPASGTYTIVAVR